MVSMGFENGEIRRGQGLNGPACIMCTETNFVSV